MTLIKPINETQQQYVRQQTEACISLARNHFQKDFPGIEIRFDLKGGMAGMYRVQQGEKLIRYNPWIFAKYFDDNLKSTVPHEVAHYISDYLYGIRNIRPHGREWKSIMQLFNADPSRTHQFNMQGIPVRRQQRYSYQCRCRHYDLTTTRHKLIQSGQRKYFCRQCATQLTASL